MIARARMSEVDSRSEAILACVEDGESTVQAIVDSTQIPRSAVYRHLTKLSQAGVLTCTDGRVRLVGHGGNGTGNGTQVGHGGNDSCHSQSHEIPPSPTKSHEIPRNPTESHGIPPVPPRIVCISLPEGEANTTKTQNAIDALVAAGIPDAVAEDLADRHPADKIAYQLKNMELSDRYGKPVEYPSTWLRLALERGWEIKSDYLDREAAEKKSAAQADRRQTDSQATIAAYRRDHEVHVAVLDAEARLTAEERERLLGQAPEVPPVLRRLALLAVLVDRTARS